MQLINVLMKSLGWTQTMKIQSDLFALQQKHPPLCPFLAVLEQCEVM